MTTRGMAQEAFALIPQPVAVSPGSGHFHVDGSTSIIVPDRASAEMMRLAHHVATVFAELGVRDVPIRMGDPGDRAINLATAEASQDALEGYSLEVVPRRITVSAPTMAGIFFGVQTLRQLIEGPSDTGSGTTRVPSVQIDDRPRFPYRGMHLDVGRHMFPVDFIKKYIDLMARYKMNTFHWHLTEDQGWRIEILKYPRLTEVGAYRAETIVEKNFDPYRGDGVRYGGFYSQDEIRDIVTYATERYVTIIPEIEMPGHSTAAIAAYPDLGCTTDPVEVATVWGVHDDIYCPKEETFRFLEDVLTEVMALFPGPYIHIGGDEAPKKHWEESAQAQEVIRREGLADTHELQSYFIKRIESFLTANDRRLIGWDEILEGGLAPDATVMSWRGMDGGIEAARQGHDVIMTPTSHVYFDYYQADPASEPLAIGGLTPLSKVYEFEPVPPQLNALEASHILGAQGNVWTEYLPTPEDVEYMVFPRLLALAEVVWSNPTSRNFDSFLDRLGRALHHLDRQNVNYRPLDPR